MNEKNEWLGTEIRLSRTAIAASQAQLAAATGLSEQSIKRLERLGANPRYKTIEKIKEVFKLLGVQLERQETGINIHLTKEVRDGIKNGTISQLTAAKVSELEAVIKDRESKGEEWGDGETAE